MATTLTNVQQQALERDGFVILSTTHVAVHAPTHVAAYPSELFSTPLPSRSHKAWKVVWEPVTKNGKQALERDGFVPK
jgi:hypothetical protein